MIKVPKVVERPVDCARLESVETKGATPLEIMERQHAAILAYEERIKACAK